MNSGDNFIVKDQSSGRRGWTVVAISASIALLLGIAAVAASVLASSPSTNGAVRETSTTEAQPSLPPPSISSGFQSTIAIAIVDSIAVYEEPTETAAVKTELARKNEHGVDQVFLVKESRDAWLKVLLPIRPNGSTGWIRVRDVKITGTNYLIRINVAEKRLELIESGRLRTQFPIAVGKRNTPTPGGEYYIKELLKPTKPNGPYGTFAYGLNGFSNVLETFEGGPGVIGIHGTNDPSSIGKDVSAGCIRLRNQDIEQLVAVLPLGTPVEIHAE